MKLFKKIVLFILIIFIAMQFIQPVRNSNSSMLPTDLEKLYDVPPVLAGLLKNSCYDCHSNNTHYPWYSSIQPGGWWMASHIKTGKAVLNFSEFGKYSNRKQQSKLQAISNSIKDETMPLQSYTLLHQNAVLSANDKKLILDWLDKTKDSLSLVN